MKVIVPGHTYELAHAPDNNGVKNNTTIVQFVVKEPGMETKEGVQTQEVLRMLIDRTMHCDNCLPHGVNDCIIYHLRMALIYHEMRALERKVEKDQLEPEHVAISTDGHFLLGIRVPPEQSEDYKSWSRRKAEDENRNLRRE